MLVHTKLWDPELEGTTDSKIGPSNIRRFRSIYWRPETSDESNYNELTWISSSLLHWLFTYS